MFEVFVYTMGDRGYAHEMARLLDPDGAVLRPGRLISAADCSTAHEKSLDVVLGDPRLCVIFDDKRSVWPSHARNVVVPQRYHFFPDSATSHGLHDSASLLRQAALGTGGDEAEESGQLAALAALCARVHSAFFDAPDADAAGDVRAVLARERSAVLAGCALVFSGLFPVGCASVEEQKLWQLATELGAVCLPELPEERPEDTGGCVGVTHVVARCEGTQKVRWARLWNVHRVTPDWLRDCGHKWARAEERHYPLPQP
jgi:RNA polymerase II C-terminal domain phosphatase-like 3/4